MGNEYAVMSKSARNIALIAKGGLLDAIVRRSPDSCQDNIDEINEELAKIEAALKSLKK
jgi:phage terminase Nu1 subunit (DNA packaging protein)